MSSSLCSSSSSFETKNLYFESLHFAKTSAPLPKSFVRPGRADGPQVANHVVHRAAVASHLAPKQLEKSIIEKRQLEEASKKIKFVRTLLIDNYDSYTYNVYQELSVINKVPPVVVRNDEWTWEEAYYFLYKQRAFDNIVISPGPGSPMHPSDIGLCLQLLLECKDIPILGVCLGHQALGFVHGAQIVHASEPIHGRLSEIEHDGCRLFHNIPSGTNSGFKVVRYHSLVIDGRSLPKELVPIAWTSTNDTLAFLETSCLIPNAYNSKTGERLSSDSLSIYPRKGCSSPSHYVNGSHREKVLMGIRHATRPHFGLQFHPESVATSHGRKMFTNFRDITVDYWKGVASSSRNNHHNGNRNSHNDSTSVSHAGQLPSAPRNRQLSDHEDGSSPSWMQNALSTSQSSVGVKNLKLRWKKLECLADKVGGTRNIFCELFGACKGEETFWLDSSSVEKGRARFSFMGKRGGPLWKQFSFRLPKQSDVTYKNGGFLSIEDAEGATTKYLENGFLDFLNQELQSFHCDEEDYQGLPFDFCGGFIGYIGYNLKVECGAASNCHESSSPDACFFFADDLIVIDHHYTDVYILSMHEKCSSPTPWLDKTEQKLLGLRTSSLKYIKEDHSKTHLFSPFEAGFISDKSRDQYIQDVKKCLRYIKDGESYELCLTTQMRKKIGKVDPLGLYLRLREQNPAPYAAWLNFSKENLSICCSSPERFLRLDKDGVLEAKPIKGTISRGSTPQQDEEHRFRLQYSEKDQAENLMIVDLLRNDLGRVCEPGSVHVPHLMEVETYASVHTMVSTIRGEKREDMGPVECIRATFPGGSMTGAPKLRSMEILDSLESCSRGVYSGSIGYFSINGTFDLNIVIRTVVVHENEASLGAGGAIVALSRPEDEYEEMILKTRAPTTAIVACQNDS